VLYYYTGMVWYLILCWFVLFILNNNKTDDKKEDTIQSDIEMGLDKSNSNNAINYATI